MTAERGLGMRVLLAWERLNPHFWGTYFGYGWRVSMSFPTGRGILGRVQN